MKIINARNKKRMMEIFKEYGVTKAAVFGSFARGEEKKSSDIDLLIKMEDGRTLFDLGGLKVDLEELFGRKVDLVEYEALHPLLKDQILKDQVSVF